MTTPNSRHSVPPLTGHPVMNAINQVFGPLSALIVGAVLGYVLREALPMWYSAGLGVMLWIGIGMQFRALAWILTSFRRATHWLTPWLHIAGGVVMIIYAIRGLT